MGLPSALARSMAARISSGDCTPRPSSEKPHTSAAIPSMSERACPRSPAVMAPKGYTWISASRAMASSSGRSVSGPSGTGERLGMAHTAVYPPAAAAAVPEATVSL